MCEDPQMLPTLHIPRYICTRDIFEHVIQMELDPVFANTIHYSIRTVVCSLHTRERRFICKSTIDFGLVRGGIGQAHKVPRVSFYFDKSHRLHSVVN